MKLRRNLFREIIKYSNLHVRRYSCAKRFKASAELHLPQRNLNSTVMPRLSTLALP
jgi:hypothetical protein